MRRPHCGTYARPWACSTITPRRSTVSEGRARAGPPSSRRLRVPPTRAPPPRRRPSLRAHSSRPRTGPFLAVPPRLVSGGCQIREMSWCEPAAAAHLADPVGLRRVGRLEPDRDDVGAGLLGLDQLLECVGARHGVEPHDGVGRGSEPSGRHRHRVRLDASSAQLVAEGTVERIASPKTVTVVPVEPGAFVIGHPFPSVERRRRPTSMVRGLLSADVPSPSGGKHLTLRAIYFGLRVCFS